LYGAIVVTKQTGLLGVRYAKSEHVDFILMDLNMPNGLSGYEAAEKIWSDSTTNSIPMIAYSGGEKEGEENMWKSSGMSAFLAKPMSERGLYSALIKSMVAN
jgi:CheY-like chemotaxis protein